jgi:hypothetical protein
MFSSLLTVPCPNLPDHFQPFAARNLLLASIVLVLGGCEPKPQITKYTVPKESTVDKAGGRAAAAQTTAPKQTIGAIFVNGDSGWFFKASDDPARLEPLSAEMRTFVESVRFSSADGDPTWTLPKGWSREPGNQFRFATVRMGDKPNAPEISVSRLPGPEPGGEEQYQLLNINRWRDQVGLAPLESDELAKESDPIQAGELRGTWVSMTGTASAGNSMAPFAAGGAATPRSLPPTAANAARSSGIKYTVPTGWEEKPAEGLRRASFLVVNGDAKLDISVTVLSASGGELLPNVNRWREQVNLPRVDKAELDKQLKSIEIGGEEGHLIEIKGEAPSGAKQTILGAIAIRGDEAWFVKAWGDTPLADREKANFEQFVRSIQFE